MKKMKNKVLIPSVFVVGIFLGMLLYFIGSNLMVKTANISIDSVQCTKGGEGFGPIVINVHNSGNSVLLVNDVHILIDGSQSPTFCAGDFTPGATSTCITNPTFSGSHNVEVQGPANTVDSPVTCS